MIYKDVSTLNYIKNIYTALEIISMLAFLCMNAVYQNQYCHRVFYVITFFFFASGPHACQSGSVPLSYISSLLYDFLITS